MNGERERAIRVWRKFRVVAVALLLGYLAWGVLTVAVAWADVTASNNPAVPVPTLGYLRPPSGASDKVARAYYDYLAKQTFATFGETYHFDLPSFLIMYAFIGGSIVLLYVFVFAWYAGRLRRNDLYPIEVYGGYITERAGPLDILDYFVWAVMLIYVVVYIVITMIFGQLY